MDEEPAGASCNYKLQVKRTWGKSLPTAFSCFLVSRMPVGTYKLCAVAASPTLNHFSSRYLSRAPGHPSGNKSLQGGVVCCLLYGWMSPLSDLGIASSILSPKTLSTGKNPHLCPGEYCENLTQVSFKCYPTLTFSESYKLSA